jgi:hypothetical protein
MAVAHAHWLDADQKRFELESSASWIVQSPPRERGAGRNPQRELLSGPMILLQKNF